MNPKSNPWTTLRTERYYESKYVAVEEDQVRHVSGRVHSYTALRFKVHGIAVLPIDEEGCTYLVGQFRYLLGQYTWELPRGSGPGDADPLATARRELREETGFEGQDWLHLFTLTPSPGISSERAPCFVAWNLVQEGQRPDETEDLRLRRMPFREAVAAATAGEIVDATSIACLLTLQARLVAGTLPTGLAQQLQGRE